MVLPFLSICYRSKEFCHGVFTHAYMYFNQIHPSIALSVSSVPPVQLAVHVIMSSSNTEAMHVYIINSLSF
jgi:hypothetical protein